MKIKLLFMGDFLLSDKYVRNAQLFQEWNPFCERFLTDLVEAHDLVIGSLDCTIGADKKIENEDRIIVKTDPAAIRTLRNLNLSILTTATNHAFDFNTAGYISTVKELAGIGIHTVGAGENLAAASSPLITEKNEIKVGWLAVADPATSAVIASLDQGGVYYPNRISDLEAQIRELKGSCDIVIFMPHWGTEWYRFPSPEQRQLAKKLLNSGVDIIVGNHPHVSQVFERINGKYVFYALGNAVVSDIAIKDAETLKQFQTNLRSIAVSIEIDKTAKVINTNLWALQFEHDEALNILGAYQSPYYQKIFAWVATRDKRYEIFWRCYCVLMEIIIIPIYYRLFGYGIKYFLKRLNYRTISMRVRLLFSRAKNKNQL